MNITASNHEVSWHIVLFDTFPFKFGSQIKPFDFKYILFFSTKPHFKI